MTQHHVSAFCVVSGGQTGVDRAALDAAMEAGIRVGGWCPKGRRATDGRISDRYPLRETDSANYVVRTELNVRDCDATLILARGILTGGTRLTEQCAKKHRKKCRITDLDCDIEVQNVSDWLLENEVYALNVAGPREQIEPGITCQSYKWLQQLFRVWPPRRD